jgi:hypothetical protein
VSNNATLASILLGLPDPIAYVRGVVRNMADWKAKMGTAFVRVGEAVQALPPNYRIEAQSIEPDGALGPFRAFNGTSHQRLQWQDSDLRGHGWSALQMSYAEVEALLAELLGYVPLRTG